MAKKEINIIITGRVASKKNSKRIFMRGGRRIVLCSVAYERYLKEALTQITKKYKSQSKVDSPYEVHYVFKMRGKAGTDVDNMVASINDILQEAGILDDDKNVMKIIAVKLPQQEEYLTEVKVISSAHQYG